MVLASRQKHQRKPLSLIKQVPEHRALGVTLDEELKWQSHIDSVCKKFARNLFLLGQLKHCISIDCRKMFFKVRLLAHINYASTLWSNASEVHLKNLTLSTEANFTWAVSVNDGKTKKTRHSSTAEAIYVQYSCAYVWSAYGLNTSICKWPPK